MPPRIPKYRHHKARQLAVVTIQGKDHYLGPYDSPESHEKYHRLIAEHVAGAESPVTVPVADTQSTPLTINEVIYAYWRYAKNYYVKNDKPTSEQDNLRHALRFLRRLYGSTPAEEFGPQCSEGSSAVHARPPYPTQGAQPCHGEE